jgi:hypothetical protein
MSENKPETGRGGGDLITRRQLLQWMPGVAALAAVGAAPPALVQAISSDEVPLPPPATTTTPAPAGGILDLPFRTVTGAAGDCAQRRGSEGGGNDPNSSPLEKILAATSLVESRLGLANWPLLDESEDANLGHFSFPISPFNITANDGTQQFLLFSNNQLISNFRRTDYLEQIQRRMSDRAVWAIREGRFGMAVVEFDRPLMSQKVDWIVRLLGYYGVKTIVWGNELNDPNTPWRDDLPALFDVLVAAVAAKKKYGLNDVEFSLPGLAYYGHGEYLQKMLRTFRDLQRTKYAGGAGDLLVQRVADHYYGPVDTLLERIRTMRGIMSAEGVTQLKYDLTEMGNPTLGDGQQVVITDQQLAEGYIPQVASIAIGSGQVDRISYYSLLDISPVHSLMQLQDGRLIKKPSYQSFVVMAKLLARLNTLAVMEEKEIVRVDARRTDDISFQIIWSKLQGRDVWVDFPRGARAFNTLGQEVKEDRAGQIVLKAREHSYLGGPARIIVTQ